MRPLCSEQGQELLVTVVAPSETVAAMVLIPKSTQALNGGVKRALAPDDGFCQTIWKETPPVLEAGVLGVPDCCDEPPEQAEREPINKMQIVKRLSK
jgi:hypothetical protein